MYPQNFACSREALSAFTLPLVLLLCFSHLYFHSLPPPTAWVLHAFMPHLADHAFLMSGVSIPFICSTCGRGDSCQQPEDKPLTQVQPVNGLGSENKTWGQMSQQLCFPWSDMQRLMS